MAIHNCSTCVHRRPIISENGLHYVCGLSWQTARSCITGRKCYYAEIPKFVKELPRWKMKNG